MLRTEYCTQKPSEAVLLHFMTQEDSCPAGVVEAEFSGKHKQLCYDRQQQVLYVGLGSISREASAARYCFRAAAKGAKYLQSIGITSVAVIVDQLPHAVETDTLIAGIYHGVFQDLRYQSADSEPSSGQLEHLYYVTHAEDPATKIRLKSASLQAEASNHMRETGNTPPNDMTPEALAKIARDLAGKQALTAHVFEKEALEAQGFGGILSVSRGSMHPPNMIELTYEPEETPKNTVVFIGKGVTFDSGGISLKPGESMEEMKFDKMGGCAVLGIMEALAQLRLPVRAVGLLPCAENMPGTGAYRPGDVIRMYDGKYIEITNTDAEGRLLLADAIAYAKQQHNPDIMVDLATLTGSAMVALGKERAALFSNHNPLRDALIQAGESTGELVWNLPHGEEFYEMMESEIADLKNAPEGRLGGASAAASFLEQWVGDTPWAHLDIAGCSWRKNATDYATAGATGFGVRLCIRFLQNYYSLAAPSNLSESSPL